VSRVLICVSRLLLGVSRLTCLKEVISIVFGGVKDVYLAEMIQNTCSFDHSWQKGDALLKTQQQESTQRVVLCHTKIGRPLFPVRSCIWLHLCPADTTQTPQILLAPGQQPACDLSLGLWEESSLHLASAWEQLEFEIYTFFTTSSFQLMCRWKSHRWSVGKNPCMAKDRLLLL